ncbi:MAG: hypothetical protein U9O94_01950 [Nanoarchaeota archaeon]|nr:hypothetical protein [Nanoarchaeota archaeon]
MEYNNAVILEDIKDYVFLGSSSKLENKIIMEDSNWSKYLPITEYQGSRYFDSWGCVGYSALNAIETYFRYLINNGLISRENVKWLKDNMYWQNGQVNFSDRYTNAKAGTKVGYGNTGSRVANTIREYGLVPEFLWPLTTEMKVEEFYAEPPSAMDELGQEFKKRFQINFESFWLKDIKSALLYSPVQVYVLAWYKNDDGIYYNPKEKVNHAVCKIRTGEKQIFDTYDPYIKTLTYDYYYHPTGYKYSVTEIINKMNIDQFLRDNDLLFVRNTKTGQFGRIMQNKLMTVETKDRATLMLLDDAVRLNGRGLSNDEWEILPKQKF